MLEVTLTHFIILFQLTFSTLHLPEFTWSENKDTSERETLNTVYVIEHQKKPYVLSRAQTQQN